MSIDIGHIMVFTLSLNLKKLNYGYNTTKKPD